jgi:ABC-2 type transport system ATP-binding protein
MQPVIELAGLGVRFGKRDILKDLRVSLSGRTIGLLGPNGAGKSTLIQTLLGFVPPSSGTASIFGNDIRHKTREIRTQVGYMPENDSFISDMTGLHFVRYMAEISGLPPEQAMERAHEAFFYVGLGEVRYRKLGTYSLGMKQLAKLAQAIAHGPKMLIMDEPTNGLDPPARQRMIQLVREIRDASDMRLIISSHLLRDVEETCEEVLILRNGRVAALCNLEEERRANRKFLELETIGANGSFSSALQQLGCECAVFTNGRMKVVMPDKIEIREVYRIAEQQGIQIRKMNHRRDSLEDIFLNAMEQTGAVHGGL